MDIKRLKFNLSMVFVTGASRSGTTMLSRMLGKHSSVAGLKELHCFGELIDPNKLHDPISKPEAIRLSENLIARSKRDVWGGVANEDRAEAEALWQDLDEVNNDNGNAFSVIIAYLAMVQGKEIPCEQTPRNIFYARQLLDRYPQLRIVHIVRDPRDVLASQKNRWKLKKLGSANVPYSETIRVWFNYHPYTITKLWTKATRLALGLKDNERCHVVRFEDIISNPQAELQKICRFLGISFEEEMLNIPQISSSHARSSDQETGVSQLSLNRWKSSLSKGEITICEKLAKIEMQAFSYPSSGHYRHLSFSMMKQVLKYPAHVIGVLISNPRRAWIQLQAVIGKTK